ncbi:endospore germination permease [Virgibacillus sp. LDC-1]|uniref:GerAB/ArcD/ProY family transporter n=1 Tax=Virgibacillus sp. LDC-1 TaxID=3039856 RepID=UPI0024DE3CDD|nr:endospore germination permease [Virgibacillus sp. LDC-1]
MGQHENRVGTKELVAIIFIMMGVKVGDDTPPILYDVLKNAAWMGPIIIALLTAVILFVLFKVASAYKQKGLIDIVFHLFGKYLGWIILFVLWLGISAATIIDSSIYSDIIVTMYFPKTPTIIIYLLLMAACTYGAKKGFGQIGSVSWAVFPYITASLIIALVISLRNGTTAFFFPFFGPGEMEVIKESIIKTSILSDYLFLFVFIPFMKDLKSFKKASWIGLILITLILIGGIMSFLLIFDYRSVQMLDYPFHEVIRYIQLGFLTNVETLFFPFWLISSLVRFTVYLYISAVIMGRLFKINNFEYAIPALATVFVFIGYIPESPDYLIFHLRENLLNILTPIFIFLPFILWAVAKLKGDLRREKTN